MAKPLLSWLTVIAVFMPITVVFAQNTGCTTSLPSRMVVGQEGRVLYDNAVNLRAEPGLGMTIAHQIAWGDMFTVIGGPRCADDYNWWQINYHDSRDGVVGWIAEGDESEYWLEPRGTRQVMEDAFGQRRYYVVTTEGMMEPEGCLQPPDDYTRVSVGLAQLNARTLFMLDHASTLYAMQGGSGNLRSRITQGSYAGGAEVASFGTHDGGGAIDLSVRDTIRGGVLADVEDLVYALRVAGFAAWLRETGLFYPNSPVHIHAVALGDQELSEAAQLQIDGPGGYLRGLDGLIAEFGGPSSDPHVGPVMCQWMLDTPGISDLTELPAGT
jgi:hypothetical protein